MVQGFLYGAPKPYEELMSKLREKGIQNETRDEKTLYEAVGRIDLNEKEPIALIFYAEKKFEIAYMSDAFWKTTEMLEKRKLKLKEDINNKGLRLNSLLVYMAKLATEDHIEERDFVYGNRYYRLALSRVAKTNSGLMLRASLSDITFIEKNDIVSRITDVNTVILDACDWIALIDYNEGIVETISAKKSRHFPDEKMSFSANPGSIIVPDTYLERYGDKQAVFDYFELERIKESIISSNAAVYSAFFRIRGENGNYQWAEFKLIPIGEIESGRFLFIETVSSIDDPYFGLNDERIIAENFSDIEKHAIEKVLWKSLMEHTDIRFFWKDKERRFKGVSKSFLDFYGFPSFEAIRGKTDEEVKWHIDDTGYRSDEEAVLNEGKVVSNVPGHNVIKGVLHNIFATKFPVYSDGKIIGLMGYFIDSAQLVPSESTVRQASFIDPETGLMNTRGFMIALVSYEDNYRKNGEDYWIVVMDIPAYEQVLRDFGTDIAEKLMGKVSDIIKNHYAIGASLSRISQSSFAIIEKCADRKDMEGRLRKCINRIKGIRSVDDHRITIYVDHDIVFGSEYNTAIRLIDLLQLNYSFKDKD